MKVINAKVQKIGPIFFGRKPLCSDRDYRTKISETARQLEGAPMKFLHRSAMALCAFLLCAAISLATVLPANAEKRIALVVGNSAYRNVPPLTNPANDAALIAKTLRDLGFELVGGSAEIDLDKPGFDAIVKRFGTSMQGADVGLFYWQFHNALWFLSVFRTFWAVAWGSRYVPLRYASRPATCLQEPRERSKVGAFLRRIKIVLASAAIVSSLTAARAAAKDAWDSCFLLDTPPIERIANCTTIIQSPKSYKKNDLAEAHYQRGKELRQPFQAYTDFDKAIADFEKAMALYSDVFNAVGQANAYNGRVSAIADRKKALASAEANPTIPADTTKAEAAAKNEAGRFAREAHAETRVALVIGNGHYAAVNRLDNPPRDAAAVAAALRNAGFANVDIESDLNREAMIKALRRFEAKVEKADWAVIYFAGHGLESGGVNYLVPVDAKLAVDKDVQDEAVPLDRVLSAIEGARKLKLVILDACRNDPFVTQMRRTIASRSIGRGLARIEPEAGTLVAYSAKHGQEALDGDGANNSPFVTALVTRLREPGLEINKLFRLVRDDVLSATGKQQEPFQYGSLPGEDYFFLPPVGAVTPPSPPDRQHADYDMAMQAGTVAATPSRSPDEIAWLRIKDSKSTDVLSGFVNKFPGSVYAALARERVLEMVELSVAGKYRPIGDIASSESTLELKRQPDGTLTFVAEVWFRNGHLCALEGTATRIRGGWHYEEAGSCPIDLRLEKDRRITLVATNSEQCAEYCGARANFQGGLQFTKKFK